MVDMARFFLDFTKKESCGKCNYCRIGTKRMLEILERITKGEGKDGDIELLEELAGKIKDGAMCGLGQTAPNPVLTTLKYFRNEYEDHIYNHKCTAKSCKALIHYEITEDCKAVQPVQDTARLAPSAARKNSSIRLILLYVSSAASARRTVSSAQLRSSRRCEENGKTVQNQY